jgi:hypothetical protein
MGAAACIAKTATFTMFAVSGMGQPWGGPMVSCNVLYSTGIPVLSYRNQQALSCSLLSAQLCSCREVFTRLYWPCALT